MYFHKQHPQSPDQETENEQHLRAQLRSPSSLYLGLRSVESLLSS